MKLERLAPDSKAFEFRFDTSVLDRLTSIYEDVVEPKLDLATLRTSGAHDKLRGDGLSFSRDTLRQPAGLGGGR